MRSIEEQKEDYKGRLYGSLLIFLTEDERLLDITSFEEAKLAIVELLPDWDTYVPLFSIGEMESLLDNAAKCLVERNVEGEGRLGYVAKNRG